MAKLYHFPIANVARYEGEYFICARVRGEPNVSDLIESDAAEIKIKVENGEIVEVVGGDYEEL